MDSWNAHPTSGDIDLPPSGVITTHCVSSVIRPGRKSSQDPLQFVKIQAADLSKKAVELIRLAEEEKITKEKIKEVEEEWQSNLLNWKSKRRVTNVHSSADPFSSDDSSDKSSRPRVKTFSEILNEKAKSGHRIGYNLQRYMDDEDDDFSQFLSTNGGTSSTTSSGAESPIKSVDVESCSSPQSMISQSLSENTNNNNFRREREKTEDGEERRDEKTASSQTAKALITTNASSSPSTDEQTSSTSKTITTTTNGKSSMNVNGRSTTSFVSPSSLNAAVGSFENGSEPNHSASHYHHLSSSSSLSSKIASSASEKTLLVGGMPSSSTFVSSRDEEHLVGESSSKNGSYNGTARNNNNDEDEGEDNNDKERKSREQQKNVWNYLLQQDQEHRLRIHADDADDDEEEEEEDGLNESGENDESDLQRQEQLINFRAKLSAFENLAKSEREKSLPSLSSSNSLHNREASSSASSTTSSGINGCPASKTLSGGGITGGEITNHYTGGVQGQQTGGGNNNCFKQQAVHPSSRSTQVLTQQQQASNTTTINLTNGIPATRNGNSDSNKLLIGHSSQHQQYQLSNDQHFKYHQQLQTSPLSSSSTVVEQVTTQLSKTGISPNGVIVSSTTVVPSPANSSHYFNNNNNNSCQQTTNSRSAFPLSASSSLSSQATAAIHGQQQQQYQVPRPPHSSSSSTSSSSSSSLLPHHQSIHHQRDFSNASSSGSTSYPLFSPATTSVTVTSPSSILPNGMSASSNSNNNNHLAIHHHLQQIPVQAHQHQFLTNGNNLHHQQQQANGYGHSQSSSSSAGMPNSMATNGHNHNMTHHEKQVLYDQQNQYANQFVQSSLPYGVTASYVDPLAHPQQPQQPQQHYFVLEEDRRTGQTVVVQEPLYSNQQPMYQQQQQSSHLPSNGFPQQQPQQQHSLPLHGNGVYLPKPYSASTSCLPPKKPLHSGIQSSSASTSRLPLTTHGADLSIQQTTAAPSSLSASGASQVHPSLVSGGGGSDGVSAPTTHHPSIHPQQPTGYNKNHWLIQEAELRRQIAAAANGPSSTTTMTAGGRKVIVANNSQPTVTTSGTKNLGAQTSTQSQQLTTIPVTSSEQIYENFNQSTQSVPLQQLQHPSSSSSTSSVGIVSHPVLPPTTAMSTTTGASSTATHLHPPPPPQSHHHHQPHPHHPVTQPGQLPQNNNNKQNMLSVSGRKKCSSCGDELGRGCAAMVIESLSLYYHINCFRCSVCHIQLGNGSCGTDVRVRNHKLHCNNCYSNDEAGLKFSRV